MKRTVSSTVDLTLFGWVIVPHPSLSLSLFVKICSLHMESPWKLSHPFEISSLFCRSQKPIIKFENAPSCTDTQWALPPHGPNKWDIAFYFQYMFLLFLRPQKLIVTNHHIPHTPPCTSCLCSRGWNDFTAEPFTYHMWKKEDKAM